MYGTVLAVFPLINKQLPYDVASGSEITPYNKIDKPTTSGL